MVDTDSPSLLPDIRLQRMPDARLTDNPCGGSVLFPWKERELSTCPDNPGKCLHLSNKQIGKKCT